ncbi:hypothetical protein PtB15_2B264 [Puccinia triticina]|nr:hypothetical protein PtB15_2B264 [Puccinia triticina]
MLSKHTCTLRGTDEHRRVDAALRHNSSRMLHYWNQGRNGPLAHLPAVFCGFLIQEGLGIPGECKMSVQEWQQNDHYDMCAHVEEYIT